MSIWLCGECRVYSALCAPENAIVQNMSTNLSGPSNLDVPVQKFPAYDALESACHLPDAVGCDTYLISSGASDEGAACGAICQ